jgi:hypothetical protein
MVEDNWTTLTTDQKLDLLHNELTALVRHVGSLGEKINRLQQRVRALTKNGK